MKRPLSKYRPFGPLLSKSKNRESSDTNIYAPKPKFATHSTTISNAIDILGEGVIKTTQSATLQTEEEVVSLSLGGVFAENQPVTFIFDIDEIKAEHNVKPDFYYMIQSVKTSIQEDNYRVVIWDWFTTATEVVSPTDISLSSVESVYVGSRGSDDIHKRLNGMIEKEDLNIADELPYSRLREEFISSAKNELNESFEHKMFQTEPPSGKIESMVLKYNRMVADEFNINISEVESIVKDEYLKESQKVWFQ
jgi:hypothetical protein